MKILFLNPHVDAEHKSVRDLKARGLHVLLATDSLQAWQMLKFHGRTVELAIVHREEASGEGEAGLEFIDTAKEDPDQRDLPIIVTTQNWSDEECLAHQNSPSGAHAYLRWPTDPAELARTIGAIFGEPLSEPIGAAFAAEAMESPEAPAFEAVADEPAALEMGPPAEISLDASGSAQPSKSNAMAVPTAADPDLDESIDAPSIPLFSEGPTPPGLPPAEASPFDSAPEMVLEDAAELFDNPAQPSPAGGISLEMPEMPPEENLFAGQQEQEAAPQPAEIPSFVADLDVRIDPKDEAKEEALFASAEALIAQEMPYLFGAGGDKAGQPDSSDIEEEAPAPKKASAPVAQDEAEPVSAPEPEVDYAQPVGDAVVPGGAAVSPDLDTLKKYLLLREQDVAALSIQLKSARNQVSKLEETLRGQRTKNNDLDHQLTQQRQRIEEFEKERQLALEGLLAEINELKFQSKTKSDKVRLLETRVREANDEMARLKERVRSDIRKIRVREKELENRLEIMRKDSEVLLAARENKIIELKRKLDLLEFNMDLLQDQYGREKEISAALRERLNQALQAVRVAGGLLDGPKAAGADGSGLGDELGHGAKKDPSKAGTAKAS